MHFLYSFMYYLAVEGAGLVPWASGPPDASFRFYLREAFQSQPHLEKRWRELFGTDVIGTDEQQLHTISHWIW